MTSLALALSAVSAVASLAALVIAIRIRAEVRKLRRQSISSEKMYWDSRLGVWTSRAEDLQRYRESIEATTPGALPHS